jgi:DNA-binding NarL/FixJ family response regulator
VAVIDIALKTGNGIDRIKRLKARSDQFRAIVWSRYSEDFYAEGALRAGALGYINKVQATSEIINAIRQVLDGMVYLSAAMAEKLKLGLTDGGELAQCALHWTLENG